MKTTIKSFIFILSMLIAMDCFSQLENNWHQFRGTNSLGIAPESAIPPLELVPDLNLAWKVPLASGLSSPCIVEDRVFLTGFNATDSALITYCIDQREGSLLWERTVFPDTLENVHSVGSPATATPATDGSAVYVYFGAYGVLCYNLEGKLLWERRLPILNAKYGSSGSPVIYENLILLNRVELNEPSILALNRHNGETVWEHALEDALFSSEPLNWSHSTPVIWKDQVIIHRALELVSLSLKDGSKKWNFGMVGLGNATPIIINDILFVNGWWNLGDSKLFDKIPDFDVMVREYDTNQNSLINFMEIPLELAFFKRPELNLPIRYDTLYPVRGFAEGFDANKDSALGKKEWSQMQETQLSFIQEHGVIAVKLDGNGASDQPVMLWKEKDYVAEVPSLVKVESEIYMIMNGGTVICMDANTGKILFRDRLGASGAYIASPLYANGNIYFASYNGKITVIKPGDTLNIIAQSDLHEKIAASPVALGKMLLIRTDAGIYAFNN